MVGQACLISLEDLLTTRLFRPAAVQRDYQWTEREVEALLDDLEQAFARTARGRDLEPAPEPDAEGEPEAAPDLALSPDPEAQPITLPEPVPEPLPEPTPPPTDQGRPYILGTIVVGPTLEGRAPIVDGLQRMTTLAALLAVLRDSPAMPEAMAQRLHAMVVADGGLARTILPLSDQTLFEEAQARGRAAKRATKPLRRDMSRRVRLALTVLRSGLSSWSAERLAGFAQFLIEQTHVVLLELDDPAVATQVFITTNTRGKPLTQADVFKGMVLDLVVRDRGEEAAVTAAQHWAQIQKKLGDRFTDYVRDTDFRLRLERQGEDYIDLLVSHLRRSGQAYGLIGELGSGAETFLSLIDPARAPDQHRAALRRMLLLPFQEWRPVAYTILRQNPTRATELLWRLERASFAMAFLVYDRRLRAEEFGKALGRLQRGQGGNWRPFPLTPARLARIEANLNQTHMDDRVQKVALRWLEAHRWPGECPAYLVDQSSVEHVLPRNPGADSDWWQVFTPTEHEASVERLGNLALMDREANGQAENFGFPEKRSHYRTKAGSYRLLDEVAGHDTWTAEIVRARSVVLVAEVMALLQRS